jgi:VanZ family protein
MSPISSKLTAMAGIFRITTIADSADAGRFGHTARWLLGAVVILILYGSLFPFEFDTRTGWSPLELAASLAFKRASRGDMIANLLLYIPVGLCMAIALPRRWRGIVVLVLTIATGTLLSLGVELLQTMEPARVASLTDVLLNAAGTAIGGVVALAYIGIGTHLRIPGLAETRPAPVPLGFVLLWLSYRLAPFVPTLDWQKIKDSLKPIFLDPAIDGVEVLRFLVGWLVIAHAVRRMWRREYAIIALVALAAGTQLGRVLVVGKTLNPAELLALTALIVLLPVMRRIPQPRRLLVLSLALVAVIVVQGLEPWHLEPQANPFSWIPFKNSLSDSLEINISVLLEKFFWYASLVWLLAQRSGALWPSAIAAALLVGAIEFVQLWLPGRSAEITDPLLVLGAAALLGLLGGDERWRRSESAVS